MSTPRHSIDAPLALRAFGSDALVGVRVLVVVIGRGKRTRATEAIR